MKKTLFTAALVTFVGIASTAFASPTGKVELYNLCKSADTGAPASADCAALNASMSAALQSCMATAEAKKQSTRNAQGYRAQYVICTANVHQQFGTVGH